MGTKHSNTVSAQVVLKPASGKEPTPETPITSENVHLYQPADDDVSQARKYFSEQGFTVEPAYGGSFSITGPVSLFEKVFATELSETEKGGINARHPDDSKKLELPVEELPKAEKKRISTVTFSEPPDFGPTNY